MGASVMGASVAMSLKSSDVEEGLNIASSLFEEFNKRLVMQNWNWSKSKHYFGMVLVLHFMMLLRHRMSGKPGCLQICPDRHRFH